MITPREMPYGEWISPISAERIAGHSLRFQDLVTDEKEIFWTESRPREGGRSALVKLGPNGAAVDVPGSGDYSARSLVNSYGGGAFAAVAGTLYFVNYRGGTDPDQRIVRLGPDGMAAPITPETGGKACYGDLIVDPHRDRIIAVQQDSRVLTSSGQPTQRLVAADTRKAEEPRILAEGHDFFSSPCLSPDGLQLAWLAWDYPHMPWDATELWLAEIGPDGALHHQRHIAGDGGESLFQPHWSPDGQLTFCSDRDNWWNLYRWNGGGPEQITAVQAEIGLPQWNLGRSIYAYTSAQEIVCGVCTAGRWRLCRVDLRSGSMEELSAAWTDVSHVRASAGAVVCFAGSPTQPRSVARINVATGESEILRASAVLSDPLIPYLSSPEEISFPTTDGETAHAFYYPPHSPEFIAPTGEKPPLLILSHGGPTAATSSQLDLQVQYFTSRGFAVVDVNYRGSTGYGREYRLGLYGHWGERDAADCANAGRYLVMRGLADERRIAARGGSAGGYITLCLAAFHDLLAVGASYYGISDVLALAEHTHNFEARYTDLLIGPLPECESLYRERSALHHAADIRCPLLFFQGDEDAAVPPAQTLEMVRLLQRSRVPAAYLLFKGEQHGFRIAANIQAALEKELEFYGLFLHFTPAGPGAR